MNLVRMPGVFAYINPVEVIAIELVDGPENTTQVRVTFRGRKEYRCYPLAEGYTLSDWVRALSPNQERL